MKRVLYGILFLVIGLTGCGPSMTPTPLPPPPTAEPATAIAATSTPSLAPVNLAGPEAGSEMRWLDGSSLVYVPGSSFTMGSGIGDAPVHSVTLDGYWIYKTKVTNRMYAQCVAVGSCTPPAQELGGPVYSNPEFANHPVVGVTWDQAQGYCTWAQGRLPTEAEWEKAARGPSGALYPWGNDDPACDLLNFGYCIGHTTEVDSYGVGKSPYGALDMAGNVYEWVGDWYGETYYSNSPPVDPTGPESGQYRVIRGSSFETDFDQAESAIRHYGASVFHSRDTGFRCAVPQPKALAPYCQLSSYVPSAAASSGVCQVPLSEVAGQYCAGGNGYATVDIPDGAIYEVIGKEMECTEANVEGQRRLVCRGPRAKETTHEITVCNPVCSNSPDVTGAEPTCDPGYTLDPNSGACNYTPIIGDVGVAGCPEGYVLVDQGGQKSCVVGLSANAQCPTGLYFDSLYGACVPGDGQAYAPYGIDNPDLASRTYQGCAPGYSYDPTFQCCQAVVGGTYPGCSPGATFDAALGVCSPGEVRLSGPGCVTVSVTILKCSEPVDICGKITSEAVCIRNAYACVWDDKINVCLLKK